jgi:flagellar hook capping protein FlgD
MGRRRELNRFTSVVLCSLTVGTLATQLHAAVNVALVPTVAKVGAGGTFEVHIRVTQTGDEFNSYQAVVHFDPAAVTYVPTSPLALQEGQYMKDACGQTFHWFTQGTTEVGVVHSILCAGMELTGPGDLYVLHFQATGAPQTTPITFTSVEFVRAGIQVPVVNVSNTTIRIEQPSDVPALPAAKFVLSIAPNPFNPNTVIDVGAATAGQQSVEVYDTAGHRLRVLQDGYFAAGPRHISWDGRRDDGTRLASGVYIVRVSSGDVSESRCVVMLK